MSHDICPGCFLLHDRMLGDRAVPVPPQCQSPRGPHVGCPTGRTPPVSHPTSPTPPSLALAGTIE